MMKNYKGYFVFLFLLFLIKQSIWSQSREIDSLKGLLQTAKDDTNKVNLLHQLCIEYQHAGEFDSAYSDEQKTLQLSQRIKWSVGIAKAYNSLGAIQDYYGNYEQALDYYNKSLRIATEAGDKKRIAIQLTSLGGMFVKTNAYNKGLEYYLEALKISRSVGDKNTEAVVLCNIGVIYERQANYTQALDYYFKSLTLFDNMNDRHKACHMTNALGIIYLKLRDYDKSYSYFSKSLKTATEIKNRPMEATSLTSIALIYQEKKEYSKALLFHFKALEMIREMEDKKMQATAFGNIANVYAFLCDSAEEKGNIKSGRDFRKKSLEYDFKALKLDMEIQDKHFIALHLQNIGIIYSAVGNYGEAEKILLKGLAYADTVRSLELRSGIHSSLSDLYQDWKKYPLALLHYKESVALKDSIFSEENIKKTVQLEMNYEFEKKEALARSEQEKKEAILLAERNKQKIIFWSVCCFLALMTVFAGLVYRSFLQKKKANMEITKQKMIIEEKQKEIIDSIRYASRIQKSLLPNEKQITKILDKLN